MVFATTTIYFVEELAGEIPPTNMALFYALNLPYLVVPVLAALYVTVMRRRQ
jgi:hypothetical protein